MKTPTYYERIYPTLGAHFLPKYQFGLVKLPIVSEPNRIEICGCLQNQWTFDYHDFETMFWRIFFFYEWPESKIRHLGHFSVFINFSLQIQRFNYFDNQSDKLHADIELWQFKTGWFYRNHFRFVWPFWFSSKLFLLLTSHNSNLISLSLIENWIDEISSIRL